MFDDFFLKYEEERDVLTNLYRRNVIFDYITNLISENRPFAFMMIDIDNFKIVNDTYGHLAGDEILKLVGESLKNLIKDVGVIGRYGGDEFVVVVPDKVEYEDTWKVAYDILKSAQNIKLNGEDISISYTIGTSRFPKDGSNIDELIELADKALYRGKIKGRNCFIIYLPEKHADIKLQTIREKVYSPLNLHAKVNQMLTKSDNVAENIKKTINFIGPYLLIDHFCIEAGNKLLFEYNHPLAPSLSFSPYTPRLIETMMSRYGTLIQNVTRDSELIGKSEMMDTIIQQGVCSIVMLKIEAFGTLYGYLRVEMTNVGTGRIWQNEDLVLLQDIASMMAMVLYSKNEKLA